MTEPKSQNDMGTGARKDESGGGLLRSPVCTDILITQLRGTLLSMPVELMFEVSGYVTLKDLIALSQTSKALRGTLHSHMFSAVWKAALRAAGAPECPPEFSEHKWVAFLYGQPICERCGAAGVHHVQIYIRRRVCARCKRKYLINTVELPELFPNLDAAVLDMVPYAQSGGPLPSPRYQGKFFWASDVKRISAEWALLQGDVEAHVEGAEEKAAAYRAQRIADMKHIAEYAENYYYSTRNIGMKSRKKAIGKRMVRFDAIRARLLALGHDAQDINYPAFCLPEFQHGAELTDECWAHMHARAVALVESRRDARLDIRAMLRIDGIRMLHTLYLKHVKSVTPREWCYLPSIHELIEFPVFKPIVEAPSSVIVSLATFQSAAELPTVISEWLSAKKARITAMLGPQPETVGDPLDLATSVFECTSSACWGVSRPYNSEKTRSPLISWEAIAAHSCQPVGQHKSISSFAPTSVGVSHLGGIAAAALVRGAGLDPASATIAQMDALDLHFACLECSPGRPRKVGYPWKYAVAHSMAENHATWHKMSSEEAERVKRRSRISWTGSWSCNHCAKYFNEGYVKLLVLKHLGKVHKIADPTEPGDLFRYPGECYASSFDLGSTEIIVPTPADVASA